MDFLLGIASSLLQNTIVLGIFGFLAFFFRDWILERIRSRSSAAEKEYLERLKNNLSSQDAVLQALRSASFSRFEHRRSIVVEKQFSAIETLWQAVTDLNGFLMSVKLLDVVDTDALAELSKTDESAKQLVSVFSGGENFDATLKKFQATNPEIVRPFVPMKMWALYSAYSAIVVSYAIQAKAMEFGVPGILSESDDHLKKAVLEALPHQSQLFEDFSSIRYSIFLDILRDQIVDEIRKFSSGEAESAEDIAAAKKILQSLPDRDVSPLDTRLTP